MERGACDFGVACELIPKSDDEEAINALRTRVQGLRPVADLEQMPAAHGHAWAGLVEGAAVGA
eukprot:4779572-Alexandrium_andersonii.AAC.1